MIRPDGVGGRTNDTDLIAAAKLEALSIASKIIVRDCHRYLCNVANRRHSSDETFSKWSSRGLPLNLVNGCRVWMCLNQFHGRKNRKTDATLGRTQSSIDFSLHPWKCIWAWISQGIAGMWFFGMKMQICGG
jgi:hypothetical protein